MPGYDRTGPAGMGPRTGGGLGYCASPSTGRGYDTYYYPDNAPGWGAGYGRRGRGAGFCWRGRGWGFGRQAWAPASVGRPQDERELLQDQAAELRSRLAELEKRLAQMEAQAPDPDQGQ